MEFHSIFLQVRNIILSCVYEGKLPVVIHSACVISKYSTCEMSQCSSPSFTTYLNYSSSIVVYFFMNNLSSLTVLLSEVIFVIIITHKAAQ